MPSSIQNKYPTFIWVVAAFVMLLVAFYAIKKGEFLKKLVFPGGSVEFEPAPKTDMVTFRVSYNLPHRSQSPSGPALQGQAVVYVGGLKTMLTVDQANPFATSVVKMEKAKSGTVAGSDEYSYRLEITEIWPPSDQVSYSYKIEKSTEGKIEIKDGDGFKVEITTLMYVETREYEQKAIISKVLSEKEKKENAKKFFDALDKMENIPDKPYTPK